MQHKIRRPHEQRPPTRDEDQPKPGLQLKRSLAGMDVADQEAALQPVQLKGEPTGDVHAAAARGVAGVGGALPHHGRIQAAFGAHDVSHVQAHVGGEAAKASAEMGAQAYATGDHVAFGAAPDLHTAAHEAAHIVQQRGGVSLSGGVGQAGDAHERHADQVADAVVAGRSAEGMLDRYNGVGGGSGAVQRLGGVKYMQWKSSVAVPKVSEFKQKYPQLKLDADGVLEEMARVNQGETSGGELTEVLEQKLQALLSPKNDAPQKRSEAPMGLPKDGPVFDQPKQQPPKEQSKQQPGQQPPKEQSNQPPKEQSNQSPKEKPRQQPPKEQPRQQPKGQLDRPPKEQSNEQPKEQPRQDVGPSSSDGGKLSMIKFLRWKSSVGAQKVELVKKANSKLAGEAQKTLDGMHEELKEGVGEAELGLLLDKKLKELTLKSQVPRLGGVDNPAKLPQSQQQGDNVTEKFDTMDKEGGLLMRAVADHKELDVFLESIPSESATQDDLKQRQFFLEKYSYIRTDASMRCFGGRNMGFLLDPSQMTESILTREDKSMLMSPGDVMSGNQKAFTTKDRNIPKVDVQNGFHGIVTQQNQLKQNGESLGNWNEVQTLTAKPNAYMGLFYAWPTVTEYDKVFTSGRKQELAKKWFEKTGQKSLNIYLYQHRGNPSKEDNDGKELEQAKAALGKANASQMTLIETVVYDGGGKEEDKK